MLLVQVNLFVLTLLVNQTSKQVIKAQIGGVIYLSARWVLQVSLYDPVSIRESVGAVCAQIISQTICNVMIAIVSILARENL
jgi:hypothetical protein